MRKEQKAGSGGPGVDAPLRSEPRGGKVLLLRRRVTERGRQEGHPQLPDGDAVSLWESAAEGALHAAPAPGLGRGPVTAAPWDSSASQLPAGA